MSAHRPWALLLLLQVLQACGVERYFGPYPLAVPTEIGERSAARTFALPLDPDAQAAWAALSDCENQAEEPVPPCRCDHPVVTVGSLPLRLDYRVENSDEFASAGVWLALEAPPDAPPPAEIPDLPTLEPMLLHTIRLKPGEEAAGTFTEDDLVGAERAFALARYATCGSTEPAPLRWLAGVSLLEGAGPLAFEAVFRVRTRGM